VLGGQAIYGSLFRKAGGKAADSDSDEDAVPILPTNLNTR
jgi:hypothetical protein